MLDQTQSQWRRTALCAAALAGCIATASAFADGMGSDNPYSPAHGHEYRHGVVPTREAWEHMKEYANWYASPAAGQSKTLAFGGGVDGIGVTSGSPKVYLVFWGSQWGTQTTDANGNMTFSGDPVNAAPYLQQMFKGLGTGGEL